MTSRRLFLLLGLPLVAGLALGFAAAILAGHLATPDALWRDVYHDRNSHLLRGLDLALDLRAADLTGFLLHATTGVVWPPLHPILMSLVLAPDLATELAILPGLAGWALTMPLLWLIAGRVLNEPPLAAGAGAVAVLFTLASPGLRLLAGDVMHEGLGAGLVTAVLYCFIRAADAQWSAPSVRLLGFCLTFLFFTKFNYWLVTAAALALAVLPEFTPPAGWRAVLAARGLLRDWALHPLTLAGLLGGLAGLAFGQNEVTLLGRAFRLEPQLLLGSSYGLALIGFCLAWRRHRPTLPTPLLTLARWQGVPLLLWFLVPGALGTFVWFVGPTHHGATAIYAPWRAVLFQWEGFSRGFHVAPWSATLAALLALVGGWRLARGAVGGRAVATLAGLATLIIILHPQQQWRFQATFLPALWACAGIGAAVLLARARWSATFLLAGFVLALASQPPDRAMAEAVAIRRPASPSDLALAAAYLPLLDHATTTGVATNFGVSDLFAWTIRAHCRCRAVVEQPWVQNAADQAEAAALAAAWLTATPATRVIQVHAPAPYALPGQVALGDRLRGVEGALAAQTIFVPTGTSVAVGEASVTVWRRVGQAVEAPRRRHLFSVLAASMALLVVGLLAWPSRSRGVKH